MVSQNDITWVFKIFSIFRTASPFPRLKINITKDDKICGKIISKGYSMCGNLRQKFRANLIQKCLSMMVKSLDVMMGYEYISNTISTSKNVLLVL